MIETETKSHLILKVKSTNDGSMLIAHEQPIVPHTIMGRAQRAFVKLRGQSKLSDTQYHLADMILGLKMRNNEYEVLVWWLGFDAADDETLETF